MPDPSLAIPPHDDSPASLKKSASAAKTSPAPNTASSPASPPSSPIANPSTSDAPELKPPLKNKGKAKETQSPSSGSASSAEKPRSKKRPTTDALHLEQYITRDHLHSAALITQLETANDEIKRKRREVEYYVQLRRERHVNPAAVFGPGYQGFGNGFTDGKARVVYPCQRKRPGNRKARELRLSRAQLQEQSEEGDMLVPVRLDVDYDKIKLRDTFTWNLYDRTVPLELFAEQLVEDFHLPLNPALVHTVVNTIKEQVTEYHPHVFFSDDPLDPSLPYLAYKNDDMRVLIKLDITIGQHTLVDQFEWDINNPLNNAEEFAQLLTRELSLSGEFTTAIAHSIREQTQLFTKALYITGHPFDGRPIDDEDIRSAMLPSPLPSIFRPPVHAKEYTPRLYELSELDLDRAEKSQSRADRRLKRRTNRRGGPTMPDLRDMPKTHRTQIVSSVLPGAVAKISDLEKTMASKTIKDGDSEDEYTDSEPEETPPEKLIPGFRNMTKRQQQNALRAAGQRSETPEILALPSRQVHEPVPPSSLSNPVHQQPSRQLLPRRPGVPHHIDSALLKLKISRERMQKYSMEMQRRDAMRRAEVQQAAQRQRQEVLLQQQERARLQQQQQEQQNTAMPPPQASPSNPPPTPQTPNRPEVRVPPPPEWLTAALRELQSQYPQDRFEGAMRQQFTDPSTNQVIPAQQAAELQASGKELSTAFVPRIRCHDCPGKLYTPGPETTVENFLMHLKNKRHRERVDSRLAKTNGTSQLASSPSAAS